MLNIRKGLFETNSSSCHSIVITKDEWYDNQIDDKYYEIKGGYYGRSPQLPFEDTEGKLNYIWTMVEELYGWHFDYDKPIDKEKWKFELYIANPKKYQLWQDMIHEICPNAKLIPIKPDNYDAGIDHGYNLSNFAQALEESPQLLRYLLLSYSWISIAGDEYPCWENILPYPWGELSNINEHTVVYMKGC